MKGGRSPMDRAADGLQESGRALTAMYEAARVSLPEILHRVDRTLDLMERGVSALERLTPPVDSDPEPSDPTDS